MDKRHHKKKKRKPLVDNTPIEEVKLVTPRHEEQPKRRRDEEHAAIDDVKQQLGAEKESSKKILDQLFGSGKKAKKDDDGEKSIIASDHSGKKHKSKPAQPEISSNWMKLKATLPPPKKPRFKKSAPVVEVEEPKEETTKKRKFPNEPDKRQKKALAKLPPLPKDDLTITKFLSLDCEMVGAGDRGEESMLARVSIVNVYGNAVYDKYVLPTDRVTDYRTRWSGIREGDLVPGKAFPFAQVQKEVAELLQDRVLVGHALHNDLRVLMLSHPFTMMRDTSKYRPLQKSKGMPRALRKLVSYHFGQTIQQGEHSSVEDARAAMLVYLLHKKDWEEKIKQRVRRMKRFSKKKKPSAAAANDVSVPERDDEDDDEGSNDRHGGGRRRGGEEDGDDGLSDADFNGFMAAVKESV